MLKDMGIKQRREVAYWFMLILGILLNGFQVIKYLLGELEYSRLELIVLVVGVAFMIFPKFILNVFEKLITSKNESNE